MSPGNPLAVWRPVVGLDFAGFVLGDLRNRFARDIEVAQALQAIAPEQLLAVGRPDRLVVIGVGSFGQLLRLAFAVLGADVELVLARFIGVIGNPFPVRRPDRVALVRVGGFRQGARRAVFGRDGKEIAARDDHRALAVRREVD